MSPALALLLTGTLALAGFSAVCAGMARHGGHFVSRPIGRSPRRALSQVGFGLLALSLLPCLFTFETGVGLVNWIGALTAAALPIPFGLPYLPRPVPLISAATSLAAAALLILVA